MKFKGFCPVHPTEDPQKVRAAVLNIFPHAEIEVSDDSISFTTPDLDRFKELLKDQQIRDTAMMVIERGLGDDSSRFFLNKQAAFVERINFTDGDSTLGDIELTILEGARQFISDITPVLD